MFILELFQNTGLLIALIFVQWVIARYWDRSGLLSQIASGVLFGTVCVIGMMEPVVLAPGLIFDARTVVLSLGALFGGPVVGAIAGAMAAAFRIHLGGAGVWVAMFVIAAALGIGLMFRHFHSSAMSAIGVSLLLALGVSVHLTAVALFYFLPLDYFDRILRYIAVPYVSILSLTTVALGLILREIDRARRFGAILDQSVSRYERLFDTAAVSIWDEDYSAIIRALAKLRAQGVVDLRGYLAEHPDHLMALARSVAVNRVNPASLRLFKARNSVDLIVGIDRTFGPNAPDTFVDELCAIWDGHPSFSAVTQFRALDGTLIDAVISMPLVETEEAARSVPVSIVDIGTQKRAERELDDERRRLQEVLWGTNAGTWEWNVQDGLVTFNERWAEMVGYSLEELTPVSIATWARLVHPEDMETSNARLQQVFMKETVQYECEARMRHKSGEWIWILDRGRVVEWTADGKPLRMSGTHVDITARKLAEEKTARLAAIRDTIRQCQSAMLREDDEHVLLQRMAEILVATRGFALVWFGVPEQDEVRTIRPVALAGGHSSYLDTVSVHWSDDALSQGPTGMAVKTGEIQILRNPAEAPAFRPWTELAKVEGFLSSIALPLSYQGTILAVLSVYSTRLENFDEEEVALLSEFSDDLRLRLGSMRAEAEKERINAAFGRSAMGAVNAISATIEKRDPYTAGHQRRVSELSVAVAGALGWDAFRIEGLRLGALIHDIGKIYVPSEILNRPGKLTPNEFLIIKAHPEVGAEILEHVEFPWPIRDMVAQHHERLDGTGYPKGLKADEIIDEAKIIAVADVVEAITAHRPYRPARGIEAGLEEIARGRGTAYDPAIVDACTRLIRDGTFQWAPAAE